MNTAGRVEVGNRAVWIGCEIRRTRGRIVELVEFRVDLLKLTGDAAFLNPRFGRMPLTIAILVVRLRTEAGARESRCYCGRVPTFPPLEVSASLLSMVALIAAMISDLVFMLVSPLPQIFLAVPFWKLSVQHSRCLAVDLVGAFESCLFILRR